MVQTLDCPKCGAPLNHEPQPGEETTECPYCHETVVIPKDLRVARPRQVVIQSAKPASSNTRGVGYIILGIIVITIIIGGIISWISSATSNSSSNDPTPEVVSAAEAWKQATQQASDDATATVEAKSTLDALGQLLLTEKTWALIPALDFNNSTSGWASGDVRDDYISGTRATGDGKYTWNVTAVQSTAYFSFPNIPTYSDFFAGVDVNLVKMPDDDQADAGLVLRHNSDAHTWYYFSVNYLGQYYFGWYNGSDWQALIPETTSDAIKLHENNRIEVGASGSSFIFLINGKVIDHFSDNSLKDGEIGVGINLPAKDEKATIVFGNFTVQSNNTPIK